MGFLGFGVQSCGAAGLRVSPPLLIPPSSSPPLFGEKKKDTLLALDLPSGPGSVFSSSEDFISFCHFFLLLHLFLHDDFQHDA